MRGGVNMMRWVLILCGRGGGGVNIIRLLHHKVVCVCCLCVLLVCQVSTHLFIQLRAIAFLQSLP